MTVEVKDINVSVFMANAAAGALISGIVVLAAQNAVLAMLTETNQEYSAAYTSDPIMELRDKTKPWNPDPGAGDAYNPYVALDTDDAYQKKMVDDYNVAAEPNNPKGQPKAMDDWIDQYIIGAGTNVNELSQAFVITVEGNYSNPPYWNDETSPTTVSAMNNVINLISASGQQVAQIGQQLIKMLLSLVQQAATAGQPYSDAASGAAGVQGNTANLLSSMA